MSQQLLRVGIIGAGRWATEAHVPGFQACDGVRVAAICDTDVARAEAAAAKWGIGRAYGSADAMLAAGQLDLVSIVTSDDAHARQATAAVRAGLHVLCEKPLAKTSAEAHALVDLARASPVKTKVGFTMRYAPAVMRLKELVDEGFVGRPTMLQIFIQNGQFIDPRTPRHWKMMREHAGAGAVVEYGIHILDLAAWLMGDVRRVCGAAQTLVPERPLPDGPGTARIEVDDSCAWLMEFTAGGLATCHAGWATVGRAPGVEIRIFGSKGAVQVTLTDDLPGSEALRVATAADQAFVPVEVPARLAPAMPLDSPWWRRFEHNLVKAFIDEIRADRVAAPTFEDGLRAQVLLDAVITSMTEDRWVAPG